ncbi:MAG: MMPL family transporter [Acidobacteria bacterium]|nr:MMPL family transporter [Acidobacteriota bacterium]
MEPARSAAARLRDRLRRALVGISWFSVFHPRTVLIAVAIITAGAVYCAMQLDLSTDVEDLLPRDVPSARRIREILGRYGSSEPVLVAIAGRGAEDVEDRTDLALAIRDRLADNPLVHPAQGMFGEDPWALLEGPQADALLLYLDPRAVARLPEVLTGAAIDRRVAANREVLLSPIGPVTSRLMAVDPLGFSSLALANLGAIKGGLKVSVREGVMITEDQKYVLLVVRPAVRATDIEVARKLIDSIADAARDAMGELGLEGEVGRGPVPAGLPADSVYVGLTGSPSILLDYRRMLGSDARMISVVSYVAQLVLFLFAFRRFGALLIAGTSLAVGVVWALGFAWLAIGEINIFTAGSIGILCGLTVDFTVHIYNRYLEEVHAGRDMLRAFSAAHGETGIGIIASVGVMVWSFAAAGMSEFRGLRDLGIICAAGLTLSLVVCLFLVPTMTALWVKLMPRPDRPRGLATFGLAPVLGAVLRWPRATVVVTLLLTLALTVPAIGVRLDDDFSKFRPQTAPAVMLQNDIAGRIGTSLQPVLALVPGRDADEVLERSARLERGLQQLLAEPDLGVSAVLGPSRLVPPRSRQEQVLDELRGLRARGAIDPARVEQDLLDALARHGFAVDARAREAAARARRILERDVPVTVEELRASPLGELLDDMMLRDSGGAWLGVVSTYTRQEARSTRVIPAVRAAVERAGVPAELAGVRVLSQEVRPIIFRDGLIATVVAAGGVMVILLLAFRSLLLAALTMVPLVIGILASVGVMALVGIDFNLVTISMLPLILGIAIDNGVHVVHRYVEGLEHGGHENLREVMLHTGRGVVMASLTTIAGFGALLFADYPGLISSGVLAMLGTGATLLAAVTILPALLLLVPRRRS